MRSEEEIRKVFDGFDEQESPLEWKGDNFRYGLYVGKVMALGWTLGDANSGDIANHYEYDDWILEQRSNRGPAIPGESDDDGDAGEEWKQGGAP